MEKSWESSRCNCKSQIGVMKDRRLKELKEGEGAKQNMDGLPGIFLPIDTVARHRTMGSSACDEQSK